MNQIILHEMSKSFGKKNVIKAQNACFSPGQIYGIVGQNGCGENRAVQMHERPDAHDVRAY